MSDETPEPGTKARVQTDDGEEIAVYTGFTWASEDGSRLIENVKSWEEAPQAGELAIIGAPEKLPKPPQSEADEGGEEE